MTSEYYAENTAVFLAKTTISSFIDMWAKNRTPEKQGKAQQQKFCFFNNVVMVAIDREGNKTMNGHPVAEFYRHIDEQSARQMLAGKKYLADGLCTWEDLWNAYKDRYCINAN